jgi:hypothetical protein
VGTKRRLYLPFIFAFFIVQSFMSLANAEEASHFVDDKELQEGFVHLYYDKAQDKVFLGLTANQLEQEMLFQSSLPQGVGSNDIGLDRGQLGDTRLVKFQRFGNKILLKQLNTTYRATSSNEAERKSIDEAFADSVIAGFTIAHEDTSVSSKDADEPSIFIDYTAFLLSDIHGVAARLSRTGQGGYSLDKSRSGVYLPRTKSFPNNTELEALITFGGSPKGEYIRQVTPDAKSVTVHMHHSFVALPSDGYETREFHPFSGFWKHSYIDYSVPIEADMEQRFIPRHRLAKKNPSAAQSEAVEPIVYYLDPGIPEPVMTALREGALWWDQAFAAAGYKNAFQVKVLPEDADPMDVRYNVIQWVHRATRGWSYGSSVIDPRTGEIIKGHVTLGSLRVRQDYLIALGMTSPFTKANVDTSEQIEMALDRIRQLSAHEVGHTLGIAHNFAASENNRASVMDYPHPLFELEKGKVVLKNAYDKGIGEWDKYVVAYGYQDFPKDVNESKALSELVAATQAKGLLYKSDPDARIAKRASADGHLWENGADPVEEFRRISKVREVALSNFGINSMPEGEALSSLEERLVPIYYSHRFQLNALVKQLSGLNYYYEVKQTTPANGATFVDGKVQHEALKLMIESASADYLRLPQALTSLITPKAYGSSRTRESVRGRMGIAFDPISAAEAAAGYSINAILEPVRLNRLAYQHSIDDNIPSPAKVVMSVFKELVETKSTDVLDQRIRQVALSIFFDSLSSDEPSPDVKVIMQAQLLDYQNYLTKQKRNPQALVLKKYLEHYWQTGKWLGTFAVKQLPPGSPI